MRPNRLVMSAFGPYGKVQEIDFDQLGKEGLYLITGDTGAGKTTIFDGIVYALYGQASGDYREGSMLRSQYASESTKTFVQLDFTYQDKMYSIYRNPSYQRKKVRGEGFTSESAYASLKLPSGEEINKILEVDQKIRDLIGLDVDQFKQIGMVAQGDFLKLLLAKTSDRSEIFRKIFHTERYLRLQDRLRQEAKEIIGRLKGLQDDIQRQLEESMVGEYAKEHTPKDSSYALKQCIEEKKAAYLHKLEEKQIKKKQHLELIEQKTKTEAALKKMEAKNELEEQLKKAKQEAEKAKLSNQQMAQEKAVLESLQKEIIILERDLKLYQERERLLKQRKELELKIESLLNQPILIQKQIQKLEENLKVNKDKVGKEARFTEMKVTRLETIKVLKQSRQQLSEEGKRYGDLEKNHQEILNLQKQWMNKSGQVHQMQTKLIDEETLFWKQQAGFLAKDLIENQPCPVCGSITHPNPAPLSQKVLSKEDLDYQRKLLEDTKIELDQLSQLLKGKQTSYEESQKHLLERLKPLVGEIRYDLVPETCNQYYQKISNELKAQEERLEEIDQSLRQITNAKEDIPILEEQIKERQATCLENEKLLKEKETEKVYVQKQVEKLGEDLSLENVTIARAQLRMKQDEYKKQNLQLEQKKRGAEETQLKVDKLESAYHQILKDLPNLEGLKDYEKLGQLEEQLSYELIQLEESEKAAFVLIDQNEKLYHKIENQLRKLQKVEGEYQKIVPLADTAKADLKGKAKIQLETYVQMTYFERIIQRANVRLMKMSQGQYELARKEDGASLRGQSGLDLDVLDHYSGKTRPVVTLSGGEAFKASLSLALGLSDEIQALSGGIRLDSMFIDEGFGTLDASSLDQAMRTLSSLASHDKLVGIISHVTDLKERIDKKIVVKKDLSGNSHAHISLS